MYDLFGANVAISEDTVVVAAEGDDSDRGSAYVFRQADGSTKAIADVGTYTFNGDTGVQIQVTTAGTLSSITADQTTSNHPNATTAIQTGKYWSITPTGDSFTLSMTLAMYNAPDANDKVCRYTGTGQVWDCGVDSYDAGNKTVTRNGITTLSDWAADRYLDLDGDGDVDIVDIMLVVGRWGMTSADPGWDSLYDLDGSGDIDISDIMLVAGQWRETC